MADRDFRIDLLMRAHFEQAQKALDDADRKLGRLGKTIDGVNTRGVTLQNALHGTAIAAAAAGTAAVAVLGLYIARTIEAEKVQAQLRARVKDTGEVAGRTLKELNDEAARLQTATTFDDEAIGGAEAMLLTFTQIRGINFDRTVESATDLATVMGVDVADAAKLLGKALSEPEQGLGALRKAGVTFTDAQTEQIKKMVEAGQIAEAQKLILDRLQATMGSAAEAARDTLGGALEALKNSLDNLLEGDSGDAGIVGTREAVEDLIRTLNDPATKQGFDNLIAGAVHAISTLVRFASTVADVTKFVGEEAAARINGPSIDDTVRIEQRIERLQETIAAVKKGGLSLLDAKELIPSDFLKTPTAVIARLQGELDKEHNKLQIGIELNESSVARAAKIAATATAPLRDPAPEGEGVAKPKTSKSSTDPNADIKRRIESLREEAALLGQVKDGEDKASEAAKARYATTEGEFKNKSPQLKAELIASAEALDAANARAEAEKKAKEALEETQKAYDNLLQDLRTPAEVAVDDAIAKLDTLNKAMQAGIATKADYDRAQARIAQGLVGDQPSFQGLAPEVGGAYGELTKLEQAAAAEQQWYQDSLARLQDYRAQKGASQAAADAEEERVEADHQKRMHDIEAARQQANLSIMANFFGQLAELQHSHNSKMAAIGKAAAIAQAMVNTYQAATEAYKALAGIPYVGPALGAAAAAAAIAAGLANVAQIRSQSTTGYSEGGYTGPGGKYQPAGVVHKGEGVLSQADIAAIGGPSAFFDLQRAIRDGSMRDRIYGWAGYADGGLVGASGPVAAPDWAAMDRNRTAAFSAQSSNLLTLYNLFDMDALAQKVANHPVMEKRIVVVASENGAAIRSEW